MNTVESIRPYLKDLASFHDLIRIRREADKRGDHLDEFIVRGRWLLTPSNVVMRCRTSIVYAAFDPTDFLAEVVPVSAAWATFTKMSVTSWFQHIPKPDVRCRHCVGLFDVVSAAEAHVADASSDELAFAHFDCAQLDAERRGMEFARDVFAEAGLGHAVLAPAPNEYWGPSTLAERRYPVEPWVRAKTRFGEITFGRRKSVWRIDWSAIGKPRRAEVQKDINRYDELDPLLAKTLFPTENVTKVDYEVHAWTAAKVVEYLRTLRGALERLA